MFLINSFGIIRKQNGIPVEGNSKLRIVTEVDLRGQNCGSRNVRIQVPVGVSYQCDIEKAEELMMEAAKSVRRVLKSPAPAVWLDGYGDSSVNFIVHCWIRDPKQGVGNVKSEVLKKLWHLFQENGIEIPFPQRDINLRGNDQFDQLVAAIGQRLDRSGENPS